MHNEKPSTPTPATVSLADEEAVRKIVVDTLFGLWATVNNLTRLRPSRRERYCVTESAQDLRIPQCVETGAEAVALVKEHHKRWLLGRQEPAKA